MQRKLHECSLHVIPSNGAQLKGNITFTVVDKLTLVNRIILCKCWQWLVVAAVQFLLLFSTYFKLSTLAWHCNYMCKGFHDWICLKYQWCFFQQKFLNFLTCYPWGAMEKLLGNWSEAALGYIVRLIIRLTSLPKTVSWKNCNCTTRILVKSSQIKQCVLKILIQARIILNWK